MHAGAAHVEHKVALRRYHARLSPFRSLMVAPDSTVAARRFVLPGTVRRILQRPPCAASVAPGAGLCLSDGFQCLRLLLGEPLEQSGGVEGGIPARFDRTRELTRQGERERPQRTRRRAPLHKRQRRAGHGTARSQACVDGCCHVFHLHRAPCLCGEEGVCARCGAFRQLSRRHRPSAQIGARGGQSSTCLCSPAEPAHTQASACASLAQGDAMCVRALLALIADSA